MNMVVGANSMFRTIHQILVRMSPHFNGRIVLVKTIEEAYNLIEQAKSEVQPHSPK